MVIKQYKKKTECALFVSITYNKANKDVKLPDHTSSYIKLNVGLKVNFLRNY